MKYVIICGPTCTGKTGLGVTLAHRYNGEIVNADSRQIYKLTDIGTAKPTPGEMQGIKHHLYDFLDLAETFSAYQYAESARQAINDIAKRKKLPIVVGGTGLYLKALTEGIFKSPEPDPDYRQGLDRIADQNGAAELHRMLSEIDPAAGQKIKANDRTRLIRALEVFKQTGKSIIELQKSGEYQTSLGAPLWLGLCPDRNVLYERINERVDKMIEAGFELEVKKLEPYIGHIRKRKMIGYIDMIDYLFDKAISRETAISKVKQHHRNYAKRQLTWFRRISQINWFDPLKDNIKSDILKILDIYFKNA